MKKRTEKQEQTRNKGLYLASTVLWFLAALAMGAASFRVGQAQYFSYALCFAAVGAVYLMLYLKTRAAEKAADPTRALQKKKTKQ